MKMSRLFVLTIVLAMMTAVTAMPAAADTKPASVSVQLLAVNDFHGALDPSLTKPDANNNATWYYRGGAEYLANFVNTLAAQNPNTVKISGAT